MPEKASGPDDKMSPLQLEILRASQERSDRLSKQQSRLVDVKQKESREEADKRSSLADVLSKRLDSMPMDTRIKSPNDSEDSFDDSPGLPTRSGMLKYKSQPALTSFMHGGTPPPNVAEGGSDDDGDDGSLIST